jgi:hypothetical protein
VGGAKAPRASTAGHRGCSRVTEEQNHDRCKGWRRRRRDEGRVWFVQDCELELGVSFHSNGAGVVGLQAVCGRLTHQIDVAQADDHSANAGLLSSGSKWHIIWKL